MRRQRLLPALMNLIRPWGWRYPVEPHNSVPQQRRGLAQIFRGEERLVVIVHARTKQVPIQMAELRGLPSCWGMSRWYDIVVAEEGNFSAKGLLKVVGVWGRDIDA